MDLHCIDNRCRHKVHWIKKTNTKTLPFCSNTYPETPSTLYCKLSNFLVHFSLPHRYLKQQASSKQRGVIYHVKHQTSPCSRAAAFLCFLSSEIEYFVVFILNHLWGNVMGIYHYVLTFKNKKYLVKWKKKYLTARRIADNHNFHFRLRTFVACHTLSCLLMIEEKKRIVLQGYQSPNKYRMMWMCIENLHASAYITCQRCSK